MRVLILCVRFLVLCLISICHEIDKNSLIACERDELHVYEVMNEVVLLQSPGFSNLCHDNTTDVGNFVKFALEKKWRCGGND